ncbi:S8 family serine peptidase [Actinomadura barringtoniae]|uniref:S8 family serine peptidase n=1 Tax=Actinomadura barringtoniae TaxID=1427535 RepID=A0A939PAU6_9ACTN|nr:S8 family serine peptidase [Actinomadura barringtoniae]MBO2449180.1 S8 family serine peptidase [Actinomadura barringtoniae]
MRRGRTGRALLGLVVAGGVVAIPSQVAGAATAAAGLPVGRSWTVTLLTGDVVKVRTVKGRPPLVSVTPGKGRSNKLFSKAIRPDGHVVVTPADMASRVGKIIDPALFDVTTLISQGYDDAHAKELPLIVQREAGARALAATVRETRDLPSIGAVAARQPRGQAVRLASVLGQRGVRHVWLDRKVKATAVKLDRNLGQIGAPAAWRAGVTGKGVKVAVLDTGVDATHPDLKGRIGETKNFSKAKDVVDRFGHGTHVAATIAGTGAAAGGERKGVAPGANLLVGKVLDDNGEGDDSSVIAGMEWAATRARVVNMSLGGMPSDGTDPLSTALNKLSAQHGTLFVTAAGNDGAISSIDSPGSADAALTVGAVDGQDRLAGFSSRGPRAGRYAAKPEIVAPGVNIVAARAKGTQMGDPVNARYTAASGTSMATPHVAGAVALLAQQHPAWKGPQLKAAIVGSAARVKGDAFEVGAGRLDVAAAIKGTVISHQAAPHLGTASYPKYAPLTTRLGWGTSSKTAVKLALSVRVIDRQGRTTAGAAALSASQLTVPAGGNVSTALKVDAAKLASKPGLYTAEVVAKAGRATSRTPVSFYVEPPSFDLTLKATPLPGTADGKMSASATVVNLSDVAVYAQAVDAPGTIRVPAGRYSVLGTVYDDNPDARRSALTGSPEVVVDKDTTVTLDAANAKEAGARVADRKATTLMAGVDYARLNRQAIWGEGVYTWNPGKEKVYVQPSGPATTGAFHPYGLFELSAPGELYNLVEPLGDRLPANPVHTVTPADRAKFARIQQRFAAFNGDTTKAVGEKKYAVTPDGMFDYESSAPDVPAGSVRTDYLSAHKGVMWLDEAFPKALAPWVDQLPFVDYKAGKTVTQTWGRQVLRPGPYSVKASSPSGCQPLPTTRSRGVLQYSIVDLQARTDGFDCGYFNDTSDDLLSRKVVLTADGKQVGSGVRPTWRFNVPQKARTFRLKYDVDASKFTSTSVRSSTTWSFRTPAPAGLGATPVPLLSVDYDLGLDLRNQPSGKPAVFSVARVAGSGTAKVTGLRLWTSVDDGKTWGAVAVKALGGGRFSAPMPAPVKGQYVSVRVAAQDAGGSAIDQRIIRAYLVR